MGDYTRNCTRISREGEVICEGEEEFQWDLFTSDQRRSGAILLHIIFIAYMSYAGAVVCYYFFVPSIEIITKKLKIKQDVAGAFFIAACVSLPGVIIRVIGTFYSASDKSFGSFIGSSMFNILVLIGAGCFAAKEPLRLKKWPVFRDSFFYIISILLLFTFFLDERIIWYEALLLLCWYGIYAVTLAFNNKIGQKLDACMKIQQESPSSSEEEEPEISPIDMTFPKGNILKIILYIITFPVLLPLYLTLPDVGNKEYTIAPSFKIPGRKLFIWTFIGSIIWIYVFGIGIVRFAAIVGHTVGLPAEITGLTFVALGVGLPFIVISVLLVKKGKGNMAVSASFGYNIFDVAVGFPLPSLIGSLIWGRPVRVDSEGAVCSLVLLVLFLVGFMISLVISRFKLKKVLGVILIILFIFFVCISLSFVYGVVACPIGPVKLPPVPKIPQDYF